MTLDVEPVEGPKLVRFDDLPAIDGPWPEGQPARRRRAGDRPGFDRRSFVKRVVGTGMSLGLASLTVFPPARAYADGYDILNHCPPYAGDHNCSPGCGPNAVRLAACTPNGYHDSTGCFYRLRPNECRGISWDGWIWRTTGCGPCGSANTGYRCHDGWTCPGPPCGHGCYKTICRAFVGCS